MPGFKEWQVLLCSFYGGSIIAMKNMDKTISDLGFIVYSLLFID